MRHCAFSGEDSEDFDYDQVVDWDRRLAREGPMLRRLFEDAEVGAVADVGCATGMHAIMFASWGLAVIGVDPSVELLEQARRNAGRAGAEVRWLEGGYGRLRGLLDAPVDAVVSLGNALWHAVGIDGGVGAAIADVASVLRPGGVMVLHFLNYDRLLAAGPGVLSADLRSTPAGDKVFMKVVEAVGPDRLDMRMITLTRRDGEWLAASRSSAHTPLPLGDVLRACDAAGFGEPRLLGEYDGAAFDADRSEHVILIASLGR